MEKQQIQRDNRKAVSNHAEIEARCIKVGSKIRKEHDKISLRDNNKHKTKEAPTDVAAAAAAVTVIVTNNTESNF